MDEGLITSPKLSSVLVKRQGRHVAIIASMSDDYGGIAAYEAFKQTAEAGSIYFTFNENLTTCVDDGEIVPGARWSQKWWLEQFEDTFWSFVFVAPLLYGVGYLLRKAFGQ